MKIFINRRIVEGPWGGGNKFTQALFRHATDLGHKVVNTVDNDIDVMHLQDLRPDDLGIDVNVCMAYKQQVNPGVKIIHRVNDMDLGRFNTTPWRDKAYIHCSQYIDAAIFVSEWTKSFFEKKGWKGSRKFVVSNGVNKEIFSPMEKMNNGKVNLVTHHWSNNEGKGFDIYEKIDKFVGKNTDFTFSYIGRDRGTFMNTNVVKPLFGRALGEELSKYDVYISASMYENCPNHVLESLACKIPTYATKKGGASLELVGKDHVFDCWEDLCNILQSKKFTANSYAPLSWKECIESYCNVYEVVLRDEC